MNVNNYYEDEGWDYPPPPRRRPSPQYYPQGMLNVGAPAGGRYRSRSHGQGPTPSINIYNRMTNDNEHEAGPQYPPPQYPPVQYPVAQYPAAQYPAAPPPPPAAAQHASPEARGRSGYGSGLVEDLLLADLALDHRYRSRSRGRTEAPAFDRAQAYQEFELKQRNEQLLAESRRAQWEVEQQKHQLEEDARRATQERELERIKRDMKLRSMESELKREREEEEKKVHDRRTIEDFERKQEELRRKHEEEERRIKEDMAAARRKHEEEEKRIKDSIAAAERDEAEKKKRQYEDFQREAQEKKEKEKRAYEDFLRKQKEEKEKQEQEEKEAEERLLRKQEKKAREKKEAEEKLQEEMRKRLSSVGYSQQMIDVIVDKEKAEKYKSERTDRMLAPPNRDVFPKIHRDFIAVETLKYFELPWEYDRGDPDFFLIKRSLTETQLNDIFAHTSRLRSGKLLLEGRKKKEKEFAWYRRRSHSRGAPARVGILEM